MKKNFFLISLLILTIISAKGEIFFKIEKDGMKPSYVFGTHHLAPVAMLDTIPMLKEAIESCDAVIGEIDMTQNQMALAMKMQPYMIAPSDSTLSALLTPEEFNDLNAKFTPLSPMPGVDLNALNTMRPMVISSMATMAMLQKSLPEFNPQEQLDSEFQKIFREKGKKIIPLETPEMQAQLLYCTLPITRQIEQLREILNNPEKTEEITRSLNSNYLNHDINALMQLTLDEEDDADFQKALIERRNHAWIPQLVENISSAPALIVVGALHLPGETGILNLLKQEGYTITPIN